MYDNVNISKTYYIIPLCRSITCFNIVNLTSSCVPGKKYSGLTIPLSIALVVLPIYQHLSTLKLYR